MKFYTLIITPFGEYVGEMLEGTIQQYNGLLEMTKHFYEQEVYYQYLNDGSFFVIGRETIKNSIVLVKISEDIESD